MPVALCGSKQKKITADTYKTTIFPISRQWVRIERTHFWNESTREIDVFGDCWSMAWTHFAQSKVAVRTDDRVHFLNGQMALLIPPYSSVEWILSSGEIFWQAAISNEDWPTDFPKYAVAIQRLDNEVLPTNIQDLRSFLRRNPNQKTIERCTQPTFESQLGQTFIRQHWREPLSITTLCSEIGVDHSILDRKFKLDFGLSPLNYRNRMRVLDGAHRLLLGSGRVTDVTFDVGYGSCESFNRHFKKLMRVPPSAYLSGLHK